VDRGWFAPSGMDVHAQ